MLPRVNRRGDDGVVDDNGTTLTILPEKLYNAVEFISYNYQFDPMKGRYLKKRLKHVVEPDKNCETRVEDIAWLCSLSESEIDVLISLKLLIIQRAKMIGCKEMAKKFNLKMIRAIGRVLQVLLIMLTFIKGLDCSDILFLQEEFKNLYAALILMEHLKSQIKDSSIISNTVNSTALFDACNLLNFNNEVDANIDELSTSLGADIQTLLKSPPTSKRKRKRLEESSE
ncbi:unnamed protein product [Sphenostylis stenocarpa]|uniref:Uncharacterized protein n=1 Tax=Sphenostylis stenocarpa TaxID=92480 RepID=A0AA86RWM8_9FABA|nr:unnamed protein product [Sphenostylis stenocarpa]